jgi:LuxR family maltose regulon positive regulatory protein
MSDLLLTKLTPPRLRTALVAREALLARLDDGLERKLTLLAAPAGFGKTTLVASWLASLAERQKAKGKRQNEEEVSEDAPLLSLTFSLTPSQVAWLALDRGDNDPVRFWRYVIAACQAFQADIGAAALALLHTTQQPPFESALTAFINDLAQLSGRHVLVLEDYDLITARQIHDLVDFLLDHLPATLHIMLITRSDPPLALARLRAHDDLHELRAADLRFSHAETQDFLQQALPFPLAPSAIARLEARTEGWVAGLRLAALALYGRQPAAAAQFLATFAGSHQHFAEYLTTEVLAAQPEFIQTFLLQTSGLSRLTASLCDAVTGRTDSASMLDRLERANLFLAPLDDAREWYRYHALFAEAMRHEARRRFGDEQLRTLCISASHWYEQHGLLAEAVDAALAAQAFELAAGLIECFLEARGSSNEIHTLRYWIEQLPEELLRTRPNLAFAYASALLFSSDRRAPATLALLQRPLQLAEECWRSEGNRPQLGAALAFRSMVAWWQGDLAHAFAAARQSLALLPDQEIYWRGINLLTLATEELRSGQIDAARQAALAAHSFCEAAGNGYGSRAALLLLGEVCIRQGQLHQAAHHFQQVLAEAGEDLLDRGHALIALATLAYEWNNLPGAEQHAAEAIEIGRQHAAAIGEQLVEEALLVPASLILARVLHARGETARALELLRPLVDQTSQHGWERLHREVLACQAQLALADGDMAAVERWVIACAQRGDDIALVQQEREALLVARMLIAQGEAGPALRALEHWRLVAHEQGRTGGEIEILILIAQAQLTQDQLPEATHALIQALALGQAGSYQRLFLDEAEKIAALLWAAVPDIDDEPLAMYARIIMHALSSAEGRALINKSGPAQRSTLIEPLSPQEQRVLRLLAAGLSNPEMAQELVVSVNTIKTQVQSIYRKLDVTSRKEARATAQRLNLL